MIILIIYLIKLIIIELESNKKNRKYIINIENIYKVDMLIIILLWLKSF